MFVHSFQVHGTEQVFRPETGVAIALYLSPGLNKKSAVRRVSAARMELKCLGGREEVGSNVYIMANMEMLPQICRQPKYCPFLGSSRRISA